jgi:hypothetical protein
MPVTGSVRKKPGGKQRSAGSGNLLSDNVFRTLWGPFRNRPSQPDQIDRWSARAKDFYSPGSTLSSLGCSAAVLIVWQTLAMHFSFHFLWFLSLEFRLVHPVRPRRPLQALFAQKMEVSGDNDYLPGSFWASGEAVRF